MQNRGAGPQLVRRNGRTAADSPSRRDRGAAVEPGQKSDSLSSGYPQCDFAGSVVRDRGHRIRGTHQAAETVVAVWKGVSAGGERAAAADGSAAGRDRKLE